MSFNTIGVQAIRPQPLQPGFFVGRKNTIRGARGRKHFSALEHHGVLAVMNRNTPGLESDLNRIIARARGRVIVMIEKNAFSLNIDCQLNNFIAGNTVFDNKSAPIGLQALLQFSHAGMNERHPTVGAIG